MFDSDGGFLRVHGAKGRGGRFQKYDCTGADIADAANKAWSQVYQEKAVGTICHAFPEDFERTVPDEYTKDGRAHCYLYIAIQ